jgi:hypothetical protein
LRMIQAELHTAMLAALTVASLPGGGTGGTIVYG